MKRPYFNNLIKELQELFELNKNNPVVLKEMLGELDQRTTPAALRLKEKVKALIQHLDSEQEDGLTGVDNIQIRYEPEPEIESEQKKTQRTGVLLSKNTSNSIIENIGCQNKPEKWNFKDKETVNLVHSIENSSLSKVYEEALRALISELKRTKKGENKFLLEKGFRVILDGRSTGYKFAFNEDAQIFEGAQVSINCNSNGCNGRIVSISNNELIVETDDDFGEMVRGCTISIDNTALLEALAKTLEELFSDKSSVKFNRSLAESVINGSSIAVSNSIDIIDISSDNFQFLNEFQKDAVSKSLKESILYLWGPPGTGKTKTLGVCVESLVKLNKKVLICSNTNQAVDQVLLKLCEMYGTESDIVNEGKIIRVGNIDNEALKNDWFEYVSLEGNATRLSRDLTKELEQSENLFQNIKLEIEENNKILILFKSLDEAKEAVKQVSKDIESGQLTIERNRKKNSTLSKALEKLNTELESVQSSGTLSKIFKRSEQKIGFDINNKTRSIEDLTQSTLEIEQSLVKLKEENVTSFELVNKLQLKTKEYKYSIIFNKNSDLDKEYNKIYKVIVDIKQKIEDLQKSILSSAKVVGSTVTKTFISKDIFTNFDVVIIDEASMVMLPALYYVAGLSSEKVIVSGDFRQLPPIVPTNEKEIKEVMGVDIFNSAGIVDKINTGIRVSNIVMLKEQYRMNDKICSIVSKPMYDGKLFTSNDRTSNAKEIPIDKINCKITIVDTSSVNPYCNNDPFNSKYNLLHALAIRELCSQLTAKKFISSESSVGVITPYAAQSKILKRLFKEDYFKDVSAGTVHRFQGDEKETIIIDITDSIGQDYAGIFLQAENRDDSGSKLFNVAITRAKENVIVFANLNWLNHKLPSYSMVRRFLYDMQNNGGVVNIRDVFSITQLTNKAKNLEAKISKYFEQSSSGLYYQSEFDSGFMKDVLSAEKSIVIFSGFITTKRVASYGEIFRARISEGIKVRCVTRPPDNNGSMSQEFSKEALDSLESIGCIVDTRKNLHEKIIVVDDKIVWTGSLNPLSHTSSTTEIMMRIESEELSKQISSFLSLYKVKPEESKGSLLNKENPDCPECHSRSTYIGKAKYGPYWRCESLCGWTQSFNNSSSYEKEKDSIYKTGKPSEKHPGKPEVCPKCSGDMVVRNGRYGKFWGCKNYPKCKGIVKIKK